MAGGVSSLMVGSQAANEKDAHTNDPITFFMPGILSSHNVGDPSRKTYIST